MGGPLYLGWQNSDWGVRKGSELMLPNPPPMIPDSQQASAIKSQKVVALSSLILLKAI